MTIDATALKRLSVLLDDALDLDERSRESWLASLRGEDVALVALLRDMLARHASQGTHSTDSFLTPLAWLQPSTECRAGDVVGPYRLLHELGAGGMGAVWLAERTDGQLARKVALKLPHLGWSNGIAERFAREREILATLEHPHIARLYDVGSDARGRPFMALEYVEGQPIDRYCRQHALSPAERLTLLMQVADAVAFAHSRLVVHRDLKPGNILVTAQGQVRLLDFGIAKLMEGDRAQETALTRLSGRALSRDYASPEQISGESIGTASDVYSLGVVAFELLTGAKPYRLERASAASLEAAIVAADVPLASSVAEDPALKRRLRGDLDAILNKALKKSPAERYATIDALAQDWQRHLDGRRVLARRDTLGYRAARFIQRRQVPLAAGAVTSLAFGLALGVGATSVVILALLLGLGAALWQARHAREQAHHARREAKTSQAVQSFLEGLFRANARDQRDPQQARQRTAKQLLDDGAARIESALGDAPEAKFTLLKTLAEMYVGLGEPTRAIALASQRAALAERVYGTGSPPHAEALTAWGVALVTAEQHEAAKGVLVKASAILDGLKDADPVLRIDVELALGELYRYVRDARGLPHAERAMALLLHGEPSPRWLDAQLLLGTMQGLKGNTHEAATTLERAIALAATLPGGEARLPMLYEEAAVIAEDRGDAAKAETLLRAAIDVETRLSGPANSGTVAMMRQLARLLTNQGRVREALALFDEARRRVDAWPESPDRVLLTQLLLILAGRAWLGYGHPARAVEMYDQALSMKTGAGDNPRSIAIMHTSRSMALTELGRVDEAASALREADAAIQKLDIGGPDVVFNQAQSEIRLALARDDPRTALTFWTAYTDKPTPDLTDAWVLLLRADIAWVAHDLETTEAKCAAALERMQQPPEPFGAPRLAMRARQLLGLVRLAQGRPGEALALLSDARRWSDQIQDPEYGLDRADIGVGLGQAFVALGEQPRACELLVEARAVHARHPQVGGQYAGPLRELERALADICG